MKISSLLIGNKNQKSFSNFLIGGHRLRDADKDGVPNIFDCQPFNPKKDTTIEDIKKEQGEWERAMDWVLKGKPTYAAQSEPSFYRKVKYLIDRGEMSLEQAKKIAQQKAINKYAEEMAKHGLQPVFQNGELVGFHDLKNQMSIGIQEIPKIKDIETLKRYERAGIIKTEIVQQVEAEKKAQELLKKPEPLIKDKKRIIESYISVYMGEEYKPKVFYQKTLKERVKGVGETLKTGEFWTIPSILFSYKRIKDCNSGWRCFDYLFSGKCV